MILTFHHSKNINPPKAMRKKLLLLVLITLSIITLGCKPDSNEDMQPQNQKYKIGLESLKKQALSLSDTFNGPSTKAKTLSVGSTIKLTDVISNKTTKSFDPNAPQIYIINFKDDNGFAILSDDKRMPNNVFAYSDNGNIDQNTDNPGVLNFLESAQSYVSSLNLYDYYILENTIPSKLSSEYFPDRSTKPSDWGEEGTYKMIYVCGGLPMMIRSIKALKLQTNWGQRYPYNYALPRGDGTYFVTGCVATATAQILSHYNHPSSVTIDNTTYPINWSTAKSGDIIGANIHYLMKDIGIKVCMQYDYPELNSSGAISSDVPEVLSQYGYVNPIYSEFNPQILTSEIDNNRIVYIRGISALNSGHAWVVDGYLYADNSTAVVDYVEYNNGEFIQVGQRLISYEQGFTPQDLYLHCNWGWDGRNNGYFINFNVDNPLNDSFDSNNNNNYENKRIYNYLNQMIYNIKIQ